MKKSAWITISKTTGYVRIERRKGDLTSGSENLHGPFRIRLDWLAAEFVEWVIESARKAAKAA